MAFSPLIMRHNQQERNTKHIQCLTSNIIQVLLKKKNIYANSRHNSISIQERVEQLQTIFVGYLQTVRVSPGQKHRMQNL